MERIWECLARRGMVAAAGLATFLFVVACGISDTTLPTLQPTAAVVELPSARQEPTLETVPTVSVKPVKTSEPIDTPVPTLTAQPTDTQEPAITPSPTNSWTPTTMPLPSNTPTPTNSPQPSDTPAPPTDAIAQTIDTETQASMRPEKGTATNIVAGDIIDVNIDGALYRVRYIGMDTPEWGDPYFEEARNYNAQLVAGQTVRLVKDVSDMDRFGRLLRYVYLPNGTFVNGELVRQGYALTETYPPDLSHSATFASLEQEAQEAGRGIWGVQAATPTESPSPTEPRPTAEPTSTPKIVPGDIEIIDIHYDGSVGEDECDEYAEVTNFSRSPVSIEGWRLNAGDLRQVFVFPDFDLQPGQSCRVYTNEVHQQTCGFSFGLGHEIWDNGGECGHLYDSAGNEVSRYCY